MLSIKKSAMDIIKGKPSKIPWIPRWDLMYNSMKKNGTLPDRIRNMSYYEASRETGIGIASTRNKAFREKVSNAEISTGKKGFESYTTFDTPFGSLNTVYRTTRELESHGVRGILTEFAVKTVKDIDAACFIVENTGILPLHADIKNEIDAVGEDGLVVAQAGYLPFHDIMRNWVGYEKFYCLYHDHSEKVKKLLDVLKEKFLKIEKILLECPAKIITVDGHFNTALIPPYLYSEYFVCELKTLSEKIHGRDKFLCSHADADMKGMLGAYADSGFDIAESFTPCPMTSVSVAQAAQVWKNRVTIWGGVASVMMSAQTPQEDFEKHLEDLSEQVKKTGQIRFIAGIGDNAPTDGVWDRLIKVRDFFNN